MSIVGLHDYRTDPALPQKDGVNIAHESIARLFRQAADASLQVRWHDLNTLLVDDAAARRALAGVDCVIANVGPHAHYYFLLRERLGLGFRIVRDIRTAIWSSYLLQEALCAPLLRPGDLLLVASHYTRTLYRRSFAHLAQAPILRCYPVTVGFPPPSDARPRPATAPSPQRPLTLGYLGRLSEDKNFPDLLTLLERLHQAAPGCYRLLACGDVHSPSCAPGAVAARLAASIGRSDAFVYLPARAHHDIWALLQQMDVKIFPSTSNLETLGRVLIEASHAGLPVVCGEHAAAAELVPASALCPVHYRHGVWLDTHHDHALGRVDVAAMARALLAGRQAVPRCHLDYATHGERLLRIAAGDIDASWGQDAALSASTQAFVDAVELQLPAPWSRPQALQHLQHMAAAFIELQARGRPQRDRRLDELRRLSTYPLRTERFIERSAGTACDFSNVGGIDIELCHLVRFYPRFRLRGPAATPP